jgi:hypothetical protein
MIIAVRFLDKRAGTCSNRAYERIRKTVERNARAEIR